MNQACFGKFPSTGVRGDALPKNKRREFSGRETMRQRRGSGSALLAALAVDATGTAEAQLQQFAYEAPRPSRIDNH